MEEKIIGIFREHLDPPDKEIREDMSLINDLGLCSFELVEIVSEIEDELGVSISDEDLRGIRTVGDVLACAQRINA